MRSAIVVVAMVALFRPGPMEFIPGYIRRMHGEEVVEYLHPTLESIFKETYGYPVYQEQLMFAVMNLAGYTAPEADDLRKAIGKKIHALMASLKGKFIDGCLADMSHTWADFLAEVLSCLPYGWAYFETVYKLRKGPDQSDSKLRRSASGS